jgi:hypothetical protein
MSTQNLKGEGAYKAAKKMVDRIFGADVWTKASDRWDALEPIPTPVLTTLSDLLCKTSTVISR